MSAFWSSKGVEKFVSQVKQGAVGLFILPDPPLEGCEWGVQLTLDADLRVGSLLVSMLNLNWAKFWLASLRPGAELTEEERERACQISTWAKMVGIGLAGIAVIDSCAMQGIFEEVL